MGRLWGNSAFRWVVIGRSINLFGNSIAPIALAFAIIDLTGSPTDIGLIVGARSLANVLFLLVGGVVADRIPKHVVLVGSMLVACLSQLALTLLVAAQHAQVATLMVLATVNGIATAFAMPASAALLGQVLPADDRQRGNAVNSFMRNGADTCYERRSHQGDTASSNSGSRGRRRCRPTLSRTNLRVSIHGTCWEVSWQFLLGPSPLGRPPSIWACKTRYSVPQR